MAKIEAGGRVVATKDESSGITKGKTYDVHQRKNGRLYIIGNHGDELDVQDNETNLMVINLPKTQTDNVNQPNHYTQSKFETIEVIEEITAGYSDGFVAHCAGTAIKYIARAPFKHDDGGLEDLRKAAKYLEFAVKRIEAKGQAK